MAYYERGPKQTLSNVNKHIDSSSKMRWWCDTATDSAHDSISLGSAECLSSSIDVVIVTDDVIGIVSINTSINTANGSIDTVG